MSNSESKNARGLTGDRKVHHHGLHRSLLQRRRLTAAAIVLGTWGTVACSEAIEDPPPEQPGIAVSQVTLAPDPAVCPTGGVEVQTGFDANFNGMLDADEVIGSEIICNGAVGPTLRSASDTLGTEVAQTQTVNSTDLPGTREKTLLSLNLNIPGAGRVIVVGTVRVRANSNVGEQASVYVANMEGGPLPPSRAVFDDMDMRERSHTNTRVFEVSAAGVFTGYLMAFLDVPATGQHSYDFTKRELTLLYVP